MTWLAFNDLLYKFNSRKEKDEIVVAFYQILTWLQGLILNLEMMFIAALALLQTLLVTEVRNVDKICALLIITLFIFVTYFREE